VTTVAGGPAPEGSIAPDHSQLVESGGVVAQVGLVAGRVCGAASAQGKRACSGVQGLLADLLQTVSGEGSCPPVTAAATRAESIAQILSERGVVPNRLGIDGLPGSGKSTLARALASKLDLRWISLDYKDLSVSGNLERPRTVFEHHRLFRTQDVDSFDAIIFIAESPERARAKTVRRGRFAILAAILDYNRLKRIGELAFDVCEGEPIAVPNSNLILKIKPAGGFRAIENIERRLREAGFDAAGMSKEEMLFLLAFGKPEDGITAYCSPYTCFAGLGGLAGWLSRTEPDPSADSSLNDSA